MGESFYLVNVKRQSYVHLISGRIIRRVFPFYQIMSLHQNLQSSGMERKLRWVGVFNKLSWWLLRPNKFEKYWSSYLTIQVEEFVHMSFTLIRYFSFLLTLQDIAGWRHVVVDYSFLKSYSVWLGGNIKVILPNLKWFPYLFSNLAWPSSYHPPLINFSGWYKHQLHEANLIQLGKVIFLKK